MSELMSVMKIEKPQRTEPLNDSYDKLCEIEGLVNHRLSEVKQAQGFMDEEYVVGLQKLFSVQTEWSSLLKLTNKD